VTSALTHTLRLMRWGRILARHGALRGIERDLNTPAAVRRLIRLLCIGIRVPKTPRYADAFQAIGPAAIKLGQALSTRPDLVGEVAAADLARLQDAVPPAPFAAIKAAIERSLEKPIEACSPNSIPSRSARHRSRRSTVRSPPRAARSRSRRCAPGSRKT
jgi:ubiquinone biosynthesis protein